LFALTQFTGKQTSISGPSTSSNLPELDKHEQQSIVMLTLAVGILCAIALWHGTQVLRDKMTFKPEAMFQEVFSTPLHSISDLDGHYSSEALYDTWIHFKCPTGVMLRDSDGFEVRRSTEARLWFIKRRPTDKGLESPKYLIFEWRNVSDDFHLKNEWLLHNAGTADYYYRTWGY
jgi:hypothetical protein